MRNGQGGNGSKWGGSRSGGCAEDAGDDNVGGKCGVKVQGARVDSMRRMWGSASRVDERSDRTLGHEEQTERLPGWHGKRDRLNDSTAGIGSGR